MRNKKFIIGCLIICIALGYLGYLGYTLLGSSLDYYATVSKLKEQGESIYDQKVQVNGEIVPDSIVFDTENIILKFTITDGDETLKVVYEGLKPDGLENLTDVVLKGKLNDTGVFYASSIVTKCPSKYEVDK